MRNDLRKYINLVSEATPPGSMTHVADKQQKALADAVQQAENNIDKLIENGTIQGKVEQIHDERGNKVEGQYQVITYLHFYLPVPYGDNDMRRVRLASRDIAPALPKELIMPFLQSLAKKYENAGYMVDPVHYAGGEQGWIVLKYNRSDTPQG